MIRLAVAALIALGPSTGWAHGTGSRVSAERAVVLDLHYSGGEVMPYADVQVFAPGETVAFLHARADRLGRAAFVPDRDGEWRVEGRDAEGHMVRAVVPVSGGTAPAQAGGVPAWMLWASLALNLFGLAQLWFFRGGRTGREPAMLLKSK
ncbi:MAG: hypothetical protein H0U51_10780 [Propionibacteriales bacterium]|nr:hypothetical protein [Propionibacteriales bacterium]